MLERYPAIYHDVLHSQHACKKNNTSLMDKKFFSVFISYNCGDHDAVVGDKNFILNLATAVNNLELQYPGSRKHEISLLDLITQSNDTINYFIDDDLITITAIDDRFNTFNSVDDFVNKQFVILNIQDDLHLLGRNIIGTRENIVPTLRFPHVHIDIETCYSALDTKGEYFEFIPYPFAYFHLSTVKPSLEHFDRF